MLDLGSPLYFRSFRAVPMASATIFALDHEFRIVAPQLDWALVAMIRAM